MTAREAKQNLEPFGYKGPAKWASIDAFVEANPRAKAAVTANRGMFVQSEALGFAQGGAVEPSEEAIKKLADLQFLSYKTGVSTAEIRAAKEAVGINPDHMTWQGEEKRDEYNPNAVTDLLAKYGYTNSGNSLEFYGDNKPVDPVAGAFDDLQKDIASKGEDIINSGAANRLFAEQFMADNNITADQTSFRTVAEHGETLEDLKKAYQESLKIAEKAWSNSGYTQADGKKDILGYTYKVSVLLLLLLLLLFLLVFQ